MRRSMQTNGFPFVVLAALFMLVVAVRAALSAGWNTTVTLLPCVARLPCVASGARGLLRTSTRPTMNRRTEPAPLYEHCIHPEGKSCSISVRVLVLIDPPARWTSRGCRRSRMRS